LHRRFYDRRARRQTGTWRRIENRMRGAYVYAIATARASGDESHLNESAWRTKVALRYDAAFGPFSHFLNQPTQCGSEEVAPITLDLHQSGKRPFTCQEKWTPLSSSRSHTK
jgi:hypothetical protein